jgi:hypothetical protein
LPRRRTLARLADGLLETLAEGKYTAYDVRNAVSGWRRWSVVQFWEGLNDLRDLRYINAFLSFYFVLEGMYSESVEG